MKKVTVTAQKLSELDINSLLGTEFICPCGKIHASSVKKCHIYAGAINTLADIVRGYSASSVYLVCDTNTYGAAGKKAEKILSDSGIACHTHIFSRPSKLEPDEQAVGEAVMDYKCQDVIIGVGSGVVNDICKFLKKLTQKPYIICGTAPSMDGYASDSSSMIYKGLKTTIYTCTPDEIVCDLDIVSNAPRQMILAGIGDMAAKFISICEWRISALINGEYYCEQIADIMRKYARLCCDNAQKAVQRDKEAIKNVIEGLICAGIAMNFANNSRPASGIEHYYSHLWEMRAIEEGDTSELHGISVGVGTLLALKKYEKLITLTPERERALQHAQAFDLDKWQRDVSEYFGKAADAVIEVEKRENKYSCEAIKSRLDKIVGLWCDILQIAEDELIPYDQLYTLFEQIGFPTSPEQIGQSMQSAERAYLHTRDIRDKYILSRLTYDMGVDGLMEI